MANGYFPKYVHALMSGSTAWDLTDGNLTALLVDSGYTYSSAHDFLDDVGAGTRVAEAALDNVAVSANGELSFDPEVFAGLTGDDVEGVILYYDTGSEGTSPLVARWSSASGLPLVPTGEDCTLQHSGSYALKLGTVTS